MSIKTQTARDSQLLAQVPLFARLPDTELEYLSASLETREFPDGTLLIQEDEQGEECFVILSGQVKVIKSYGTSNAWQVATLGPGSLFGEMSLISEDRRRTASVCANGSLRVKVMSHTDFHLLITRNPSIALDLLRTLSAHLNFTQNQAIQQLEEKNRQLSHAYEELKAAQDQIIEKERLERELQLAHEIQMSILPNRLPELVGFSLGAHLASARLVGGDFYDFFPVDTEHLGIVIGDVSDKGVPAALFMARTSALLRAEAMRGYSPVETLQRVNSHLVSLNAGGMFVTVLYGCLEKRSGRFIYARAGHEPPMLRYADGRVERAVFARGMALGIFDPIPLDYNELYVPPGGSLLLYTDGVTDERDAHNHPFGIEGLARAFGQPEQLNAVELCSRVVEAVKQHAGQAGQSDDITILSVGLDEPAV